MAVVSALTKKKPQKKAPLKIDPTIRKNPGSWASTYKPATTYKPPQTTATGAQQVPAANLQQVGTIAATKSIPPPQTLQSTSDRLSVGSTWDTTRGGINRQALELLRQYGDPNLHGIQYDANGNPVDLGPQVQDPNSILATIGRNQETQRKTLQNQYNAQGGFFSGAHLGAQEENTAEMDRERAKALSDYQSAIAQLGEALSGARNDWQTGLRNADIQDILDAAKNPPAAEQAATGPAGAPDPSMPGFYFAPPNIAALNNADLSAKQARALGFKLADGWHLTVRNGRIKISRY